jgi:large subunit ribosomal protein L23
MKLFDRNKKNDSSDSESKTSKEKKTETKKIGKNRLSKDKIHSVVIEPLVTEKSSLAGQMNKYVFKIKSSANKNEVKKAIEGFYNVNVTDVNILKTAPKPRRIGRIIGVKRGFKKAIVTLKEGESIQESKN